MSVMIIANLLINLLLLFGFLDFLDFQLLNLLQSFTLLQLRPLLLDARKPFITELDPSCLLCVLKEFIKHSVDVFIVRLHPLLPFRLRVMNLSFMSLFTMLIRTLAFVLFFIRKLQTPFLGLFAIRL